MKLIMILLGLLLAFLLSSVQSRHPCCPSSSCRKMPNNTNLMVMQLIPHAMRADKIPLAQWNFTTNEDFNREPQVITSAVCLGCNGHKEIKGLKATPIEYSINVFYKKLCKGQQVVCRCLETVNVGCNCVKE